MLGTVSGTGDTLINETGIVPDWYYLTDWVYSLLDTRWTT